jgi:hypothetical protein
MPFKPPVPLVTSTGKVELTRDEIQQLNLWMDQWKVRREFKNSSPRDDAVGDVLGRLLGHALGTMYPRTEQPMPPALTGELAGLSTAELLLKRDELKAWIILNPHAPPEHLTEANRRLVETVEQFWKSLP